MLSRAAGITVYGYSAPVTDVEAVELMKSANHLSQMKDIAPFTIINLAKNEDEQRKKWSEFYDVKMFLYCNKFEETIFYEQIRNSIKMWQQDYNEIYISLGNAYRKNDNYFGSVCKPIAKVLKLYDIYGMDTINGVICGNTILCHCYSPFFSYSENNGEYIKVMSEIGGRYINLFHATTDFQVNNELQFGVQDYGGFIKSPVGNVYSDKFVLMSILCQINFLLYGIEKWINNEIPTKLRFGYLLYYSLISVIEQINQKLGIALKINSKWKSDRFRNSMAHYKLGIVLKESNLIISDAMFGLTEKIFGEDYYTIKKSIYKELEKLAKQIGAYLDLPQRMVYLQ